MKNIKGYFSIFDKSQIKIFNTILELKYILFPTLASSEKIKENHTLNIFVFTLVLHILCSKISVFILK
jgi:hypothetical protein